MKHKEILIIGPTILYYSSFHSRTLNFELLRNHLQIKGNISISPLYSMYQLVLKY